MFIPMTPYARAQSTSGEVQPYLSHFNSRVPRSVQAQFHADWSKPDKHIPTLL